VNGISLKGGVNKNLHMYVAGVACLYMARGRRTGHIHIGNLHQTTEIGLSTRIAGHLLEEDAQKRAAARDKAKAKKEDLLRPRRWVPPEERDKD
jgi:hypothetical protein